MTNILNSYIKGRWFQAETGFKDILSAIDSTVVAKISSAGIHFGEVIDYAKKVGGANLRKMTFHQRADVLKKIALHLDANKEKLYTLAFQTGATKRDSWPDIDGGIITLFAYSSRARKELPDKTFVVEGPSERLSKNQTFSGQHILTSREGVAVHINAFNFPCWGLLEKLAPAFLAGIPVITKPATATAYVAEALMKLIVESGALPDGALQFICGDTGDLLDRLDGQDIVSFTGSAHTAELLQQNPSIARNAIRFIAERDSLNAAILGSDANKDSPEFANFIKEVTREMTAKAGQKCTAIRRIIVPQAYLDDVTSALKQSLSKYILGNPASKESSMGLLVSKKQRNDVIQAIRQLQSQAEIVYGSLENIDDKSAALSPVLLSCSEPLKATVIHHVEAFGPVATLMPYKTTEEAIELVKKGEGSLVASIYTYDDRFANALTFGIAPYHGRLYFIDRDSKDEATGHGSPLPALVHGGPGRAGGGEEMAGIRGIFHYMQRTALQASPKRLTKLLGEWSYGGDQTVTEEHPFRRDFDGLEIGDTIRTKERTITLDDIEHFANFTGDTFYAHMDEEAAAANPFFPGRVAHGYLLLSFAAGLFVDPLPGPLLANYGIDNLRFLKPVSPGDAIHVRLTVKEKRAARNPEYGEVRWDAEIFNQNEETVARYNLLTMSSRQPAL